MAALISPPELRDLMSGLLNDTAQEVIERSVWAGITPEIAYGALTFAACDLLAMASSIRFQPLDAGESSVRIKALAKSCEDQMLTVDALFRGGV